ncbi:MAG: hypothetical protein Q8P82_03315 [bacterium]|nr:hypothetical protein [bacterium]
MYIFLDPRYEQSVTVGVWHNAKVPRLWQYVRGDESLFLFLTKKIEAAGASSKKIKGIVTVPGPGGFSNVRTVAVVINALSYAGNIPTITVEPQVGESLIEMFGRGVEHLKKRKAFRFQPIIPEYGGLPHITKPKKKKLV